MGSSPRVRLAALAMLLTAGLCAAIVLLSISRKAVETHLNPLGFRNLSGDVAYVGDKVCASCHEAIAETYQRTGMARSWSPLQTAELIEHTGDAPIRIQDEANGFTYEVVRSAERLEVTEFRETASGDRFHELRVVASYVLGSGHKGRSYVADFGGYLQLMPVSWYSHAQRWDLSPGYRYRNYRFSRPVVPRCIACHNGYPQYVAYSENRYRKPLPTGIGCERCHGPGALHVAERRRDPPNRPPLKKDFTIVNPAHLSEALQQDVCLQCHLSTEVATVFKAGAGPFDFEPGQPLSLYRLDFTLAGRSGEEISAVSHGTRMVLSRCYTQTAGRLTCTYCHDPHRPSWELSRSDYNARCLSCHTAEQCDRPATPDSSEVDFQLFRQAHRASDCITCHMPKRDPKDIQHTTTTDHWIRRDAIFQSPPRSEGPPRPPDHYVALIDFFGVATTGEQGVAHVMFGHTWRRADYLEQGLNLLGEARRGDPNNPRWLYWASLALADLGATEQAYQLCRQAVALAADETIRVQLSEEEVLDMYLDYINYALQRGTLEEAGKAANELLAIAPDCLDAVLAQAHLELRAGRHLAAERLARRVVTSNPSKALGWQLLATTLLAQGKDLEEATTAARNACRWDPLDPVPFLTLARVLAARGRHPEAERLLRQALEFFPRNLDLYVGLTSLAMDRGDRTAARRWLRLAKERSPHDPRVQQLEHDLRGTSGAEQPRP